MLILAFESSCDETAAAVVRDGRTVLSDAILSQANMHAVYGGVVPEIASRKHIEGIAALTDQALREAGVQREDIDAVAVTYGPGLIGALHGRYRMFIITNGVMRSQTRRLKNSGLWEFFERVFISEETGFQKPQPEFMDYVAARIPGFDPAAALIIGDSPTTDMALGRSCGIDTCFFDPEGRGFAPEAGFRPTYTVRSHAEIEGLLK